MKKKESKKEVCLDNVLFSRQTKKGENVIVYSKKGKVAYIATWNSKHIFSMKRYNDVFLLLNSLEDKLETPLDFNVSVDFMTMESIMEFLKYNTANSLKDTIGIRLFELINDLTVQRKALSTKHIVDQYLSISELKKLKAYYDKYNKKVKEYFNRNYSSLPLYNVLYNKEKQSSLTSNIIDAITNENYSSNKKALACDLIVELGNKDYYFMSDKTKEELGYKMYYINKSFTKINDNDIKKLKPNKLNIDYLYSILVNQM